MLYDLTFWRSTSERAVRTAAQALLALLGTGVAGIIDVNWAQALSVAGLATTLSVLMSIVGSGIADKGTPSFVEGGE